MSNWILLIFTLFLSFSLSAQQEIEISEINFTGNKRTKERVILNEIDFALGDKIPTTEIEELITVNESRLKSIGLFNSATIEIITDKDSKSVVNIALVENWYLYPSFIFELGDRSFNVWWKEQNRDLSRINYGVRGRHYNLTGNKDPLLLVAQFGYTRKFELEYSFPYAFENNNIGFTGSVFFSDNREIPYRTLDNKPQFFQHPDERIMLQRFRTSINMRMRPAVEIHHALSLEYHNNSVDPYVVEELNSDYFRDDKTSLQFFMINYDFQFDRRINYLMPYNGYRLRFNAKKEGLAIFKEQNRFILRGVVEYYQPFSEFFGFGTKILGKTNLVRDPQSFANNTGLGWGGDLVTGYDLYVMDGIDHVLVKNHIKKRIINYDYKLKRPKFLPDQFKSINFQMHLRLNFDFAYVNDPVYFETNTLNNRWIYGYGPAIDLILYNSYLFSIEYSFNDLGEHGLFLEASNAF